jgi:DNA-binding transcriptional MocR family regulator
VPRALLRAFVTTRYLMDRQPSTLSQAVVAAFMEEGHFAVAYSVATHVRRSFPLLSVWRLATPKR